MKKKEERKKEKENDSVVNGTKSLDSNFKHLLKESPTANSIEMTTFNTVMIGFRENFRDPGLRVDSNVI